MGDGGDGCSAQWTYLMPLNCLLHTVKMEKFTSCIFATTNNNSYIHTLSSL